MSWKNVHSVWALIWCPRKLRSGAQTLCIAILLFAFGLNEACADCPAAPLTNPEDLAISFLAANGSQAAPGTLMPSTVKEGTLVYDEAVAALKICDGTNWIGVGSGGTDTLASLSCSSGEIAKYNGTAWACAADGGGAAGSVQTATQSTSPMVLADGVLTDTATLTVATSGTYSIMGRGYNVAVMPWLYFSSNCYLVVNGVQVQSSPFYYGSHDASTGSSAFFPHSLHHVASLTAGQIVKTNCLSTSNSTTRHAYAWRIDLVPVGGGSDTLAGLSCSSNEIPKWNGTAWACAADGGSGSGTPNYLVKTMSATMTGVTAGTVVNFSTLGASTGSKITQSGNRITLAPGSYALTASIRANNITNEAADYGIYDITNSAYVGTVGSVSEGANTDVASHAFVSPAVSTTYEVRVIGVSGTVDFLANSYSSFSAVELGGGSGADTLSGLSCATNEIPKWNGTAWTCATDGGGSGVSPAFFAHRNGVNQTVTTATSTKLLFTHETFDTANNFDTGTSRFTPSVAGTYQLNAMAKCTNTNTYCIVFINKNGGGIADSRVRGTLGDVTAAASVAVTANGTTDYFEAAVYVDGTVINGGAISTNFSGGLLGGGGGAGSSAPGPYLRLTYSANSLDRQNVIPFTVAESGGGASWASNRFTVVTPGLYLTTIDGFALGQHNLSFTIRKNGATLVYGTGDASQAAKAGGAGVTSVTYLNAGDYIDFYYNHDTPAIYLNAATASIAYISAGGGGSTTLAALTDVSTTGIANGKVLKYNTTSSKWEPGDASPGTDVSFSVYKAANQTIAANTWTKLTWSNEVFDTNTNFATDRFTPTVAGKYLVTLTVECAALPQGACYSSIFKNGSVHKTTLGRVGTGSNVSVTSVAVIDMNGSSDYLEGFGQTDGTVISGGPATTHFHGFLINGGGGGGGTPAPSNGYVQFNNAGAFGGDANLFWNNTNKRLGIGTASPGNDLTILQSSDTQSSAGVAVYRNNGSSRSVLFQGSDDNGYLFNYGNGGWKIYANGAHAMTIDAAGKVGIGTTAPGEKLQVAGAIKSTGTAGTLLASSTAIDNLSGTTARLISVGPSAATAGGFHFNAASSDNSINFNPMVILPNGNVGIGTTTPATKLDVNGPIQAGTGIFAAKGTTSAGLSMFSGSAPADQKTTILSTDTNGDFVAYTTNDANTVPQIFLRATRSGNTTPAVVFPNGNVGIGTTSPGTLLNGSGTAIASPLLLDVRPGTTQYGGVVVGSSRTLGTTVYRHGYFLRRNDQWHATNNGLWTGYSNTGADSEYWENVILSSAGGGANLVFMTGTASPSERMRITPSGNVGIGTTTPISKLDVAGNIAASSTTASSTVSVNSSLSGGVAQLHLSNTGAGGTSWGINAGNTATGGGLGAQLGIAEASNYRLVIAQGGNVGIGTTNPGAKLHVADSANTTLRLESGSGLASGIHHFNGATAGGGLGLFPASDTRAFLLYNSTLSNSTPIMTGLQNGNVGIGITNPDMKLTVQDSQASGFVARFKNTANATGASGIIVEASSASSAGGAALIQFLRSGGTAIGSVTHNGLGTVSYNTTSDARLKEHIVPTGTGLSTLMKIQVRDYNYLGQPDRTEQGFIAQELYEAYPQVVKVGGADAKKDPWSIDYGKLTPLLVKAVQDLKADNDNLRAELKAANDNDAEAIEELRREINALKAAK